MRYSLEGLKPTFLDDLIRVGRRMDGGYLVNERAIRQTKVLLSFGVGDDWSFEEDFLRRKPGVRILSFDFSVSREFFRRRIVDAANEIASMKFLVRALTFHGRTVRYRFRKLKYSLDLSSAFAKFFGQKNVQFFPQGVSNEKTETLLTFGDVIRMISAAELGENSLFLKMDIEQSEYRVVPDLLAYEKYCNGMVIEFHDLDILWPVFEGLMKELGVHFAVTHIHGNNLGGLIPQSGTPKTLEITFLKKNLLGAERPSREPAAYPIPDLDYPNDPFVEDFPLFFG